MRVQELIEELKKVDQQAEVCTASYDRNSGRTIVRYTNICCNTEHQAKVNQVWFSTEGSPVIFRHIPKN